MRSKSPQPKPLKTPADKASLPVRLRQQADVSVKESGLLHPSTLVVLLGLYRTLAVLDRNQSEELKGTGLNTSQFNALNVLHRAKQPLTMKQLSEMMAMQPTNISGIVRTLRERGFARQTINGTDMRSLLVSITPEGNRFLKKILPPHWAYLEKLMRGVSHEERETLVDLLKKLGESIRVCEAEEAAPVEEAAPGPARRGRGAARGQSAA